MTSMSRAVLRVLMCGRAAGAAVRHLVARLFWRATWRSKPDRLRPAEKTCMPTGRPQFSGVLRPTKRGS
ncbi:hypothetical protein ADL21_37820 [Streptomyces albus subsp. albus]|nr:hypothetical protein ADL21_37820 [Streptomyces albus subsp. albus]